MKIGDILFREPVLRFHENDKLFAFEADVSKLVLLFGMSYKELLIVLADTFKCFGVAVFASLKVSDKKLLADGIDDLLSSHFPFLSVRRRSRNGEKNRGRIPLFRLILP